MSSELMAIAACAVWIAAYVAQRRVAVSPNWLLFDGVLAVTLAVIVATREGVGRGVLVGFVVLPLLIVFST